MTIPICSLMKSKMPPTANFSQLECDPAVIDPERDIAWIPHSSGSTGIPKLFHTTHAHAMRELRLIRDPLFPNKSAWVASAVYVSATSLKSWAGRELLPSGIPMLPSPIFCQDLDGSRPPGSCYIRFTMHFLTSLECDGNKNTRPGAVEGQCTRLF